MATNPSEGSNSAPAKGDVVVVRTQRAFGVDPAIRDWRRLVPAWIASGVIHLILLALFVLIHGPSRGDSIFLEQTIIETKVEDERQYNLENADIGNDPDLPTNYDMPRIEEISVPGPANPSEEVGILNADPNAAKQTVPPPPGLGDNTGQGGGVDSNIFGKGSTFGTAGGLGGPLMKPGSFGGRSGATRERMVVEGGGNTRSEAAVARGLEWFANHQAADGKWSLDGFMNGRCNCAGGGRNNDTAGTAFGLLPLLGAGQTHKGGGKTGKYTKNVEKAIKYLMLKQNKEGDFGGGMYAHGLATIAICEAYGLTSDPILQRPAQQAINYIVKAQSDNGGWRYTPKGGGDTSVVGWQVMALKSAQMAGLDVPSPTLDGAKKWLDSCASPDGGAYGYQGPGNGPSAMTAVGLLCRQYLGWGMRNPGLQIGVEKLKQLPPSSRGTNMYYNYYATQVMHHMGGEAWQFWNPKIRDMLVDKQDQGNTPKRAHQKGSWDSTGDSYHGAGGRIMMSSLALLTLEVYYRHLPLYRRDQLGGNK
ncbi:MAG TPA: prenyltransferase/squalene oxidase repeat-containing protein [Gemmataceae bacterium]|jgi:hypothetical protein|nr:prenyltransferase/squalene oxidase repeat-containing protein [Gemmataceae bacterium]